MDLSVIIVNYNVKYFLEQCLCSVIKAGKNLQVEIIVTDNNSTDGSSDLLEPAFPQVHFIWNKTNLGFAKACNQALEMAKGEYILFLNPDTILPEDVFGSCIDFFKQNSTAGGIGVKMVDGTGAFLKESKRAFPSPFTSLYKLSGLSQLFPKSKTFGRYHLGHLSNDENHQVDVLAGAFMMIPAAVLKKVGNFDEQFFMYGEDVDLSYRIQQAGYENYYFADSTIIHFKGESTKRGSLNYVRLFYKAMNLFVKKHYSGSKAGVFIFLIQIAILVRAFFTAIGQLLKKLGLPLIDAALIFTAFMAVKYLWGRHIQQDVNYSPNVLFIAFPVFTALFLFIAFYSGLYDKGYKQSQLIRSTAVASLFLLSGYALVPESLRFSRGILVLGIVGGFILMNLLRILFVQWRLLDVSPENEERRQTIIVAGEKDYKSIFSILQKSGMQKRVLGRVQQNADNSDTALGNLQQLSKLIKQYPVKEIIYCENGLSFKEIINQVSALQNGIRNKFHASGSNSIVGSDSRNLSGDTVSKLTYYTLAKPLYRRNKRLLDVLVCLFFIITFPLHVALQKKPGRFYKNVFDVLIRRKTWVGYANDAPRLPVLLPGVITSTSLPRFMNDLPMESLHNSDNWYATSYSSLIDLQRIRRGYKYLYC